VATFFSIQTFLVSETETKPQYVVTFPYLRKEHVSVFVDASLLASASVTWIDATRVELNTTVSPGQTITLRRTTPMSARLAEYFDGSTLTEDDLNDVTLQLLYLIQEFQDSTAAIAPGGPGTDIAQQILDTVLNSDVLARLTELIPLVDINAELTLRNALLNHTDWSLDRFRAKLIDSLESGLGAQAAEIVRVEELVVTAEQASALVVDGLLVRFGTNEADITNLWLASATADEAIAKVGLEVAARVRSDDLETLLTQSSFVSGIAATATASSATLSGINSYLVGTGSFANPGSGSLGGTVSILQQQAVLTANQLATEATFRQTLASMFGGTASNPASLASAIQTAWRTYADVNSTTASRVTTLESNRQPVFFRAVAPDWRTPEFAATPWSAAGFPRDSSWFREISPGFYVPYRWALLAAAPATALLYDTFGPYNGVPGMWIEVRNDETAVTQAALIQEIAETYVSLAGVGARIEEQLQAVYGADYGTINQRLESYVNPETGVLFTGWDVRINQTGAGGVPVIAGVGLGIQQDLNNPNRTSVSEFIVMADKFKVVRPPTFDVLTGALDMATAVTPFSVEADGTVKIDGKLLVQGSLSTYDGVAGRMTFTNIDANGDPLDPLGTRLVLPSSFNNWNASSSASPFVGGSNPQRFLMWAGAGQMTHNNAIWYVDTDGNGLFKGKVSGDNITASIQAIVPVQWNGSVVPAAAAATLVQFTLAAPKPTGEAHTPVLMLSLNVQSTSSGNGALLTKLDRLVGGSWVTFHTGQLNQGSGFGINHALSALAPTTTAQETYRLTVQEVTSGDRLVVQGVTGFCIGVR